MSRNQTPAVLLTILLFALPMSVVAEAQDAPPEPESPDSPQPPPADPPHSDPDPPCVHVNMTEPTPRITPMTNC